MTGGSKGLLNILKSTEESGGTRSILAIVSPCSDCKNRRDMTKDGKPSCPRMFWERRKKEAEKSDTPSDAPPEYLTRHGKKESGGLENPVNFREGNIRLVWIATIEENRAILNSDGSTKNPSILSGKDAFDTDYIVCRQLPCIPGDAEASWFGGRQLHEWNHVVASLTKSNQVEAGSGDIVAIGGTVTKITPAQKFFMDLAKKSVNQQGT